MKENKKGRKKLTGEVTFEMKDGQSLIILYYTLPETGLEQIIVKNKDGITHVSAQGRTRFEFSDLSSRSYKIKNPHQHDFLLANPRDSLMIEDIIRAKFCGQFNPGDFVRYVMDKKFVKIVNQRIKKLVEEFEEKASTQLNQLRKRHKK